METTYENFSFNGKNFHLATLDIWDGDDANFSFKFHYHDDTYMGIIENNYKFYGSILLGRRNKPNVFYLPPEDITNYMHIIKTFYQKIYRDKELFNKIKFLLDLLCHLRVFYNGV